MVLVHLEGECRALRILWYGVSSRLSAFGEKTGVGSHIPRGIRRGWMWSLK